MTKDFQKGYLMIKKMRKNNIKYLILTFIAISINLYILILSILIKNNILILSSSILLFSGIYVLRGWIILLKKYNRIVDYEKNINT